MAELFFNRNEVIQSAPTSRGTLKVLPVGKSKTQKMVLGDHQGVLNCFSYKKGELLSAFKHLPTGVPIEEVTLGLGAQQREKVFVSQEHTVRGVNKKGKEFFKFKTNLTDTIHNVRVCDLQIWTVGAHAFNQFQDCKDKHFFSAPDRVHQMQVLSVVAEHDHNAVLGCQDHFIRVMQGSEVYYEASVEGPVRSLYHRRPRAVLGTKSRKEIVYATAEGGLGQLFLDAETVRRGWKFAAPGVSSAVEAMDSSIDMTEDGVHDLVVGRDNGDVEIYAFEPTLTSPLKLLYKKAMNECVTSVEAGFITDTTLEDIVLATYSGKVVALSQSTEDGQNIGVGTESLPGDKQLKKLQREIDSLQSRMLREREQYSKVSEDLIAVAPTTERMKVHDKFILNPTDGTYLLSLETPMPIFTVALQSDVPVELLESPDNTAIISVSPMQPEKGNYCLATYRGQESNNRVEIRMRVVEGHYGTVQAFIVPRLAPKTCQICTYRVRPLCLQHRVHKVEENRPYNELRITGGFSLAEMHAWVVYCLPEIPTRAPDEAQVTYNFQNVLMGTFLTCKYREGEGVFRSDSVTTLAILKEGITREATTRKQQIGIAVDIADQSVAHFLRLIHPKLEYQMGLSKKVHMIEALRDVQTQEEDTSFMDPSFLEVLEKTTAIEAEFKRQPRQLEYLHGIVKDLFIDYHKFKGANVKHRVPQLEMLLRDYDIHELVEFISGDAR